MSQQKLNLNHLHSYLYLNHLATLKKLYKTKNIHYSTYSSGEIT